MIIFMTFFYRFLKNYSTSASNISRETFYTTVIFKLRKFSVNLWTLCFLSYKKYIDPFTMIALHKFGRQCFLLYEPGFWWMIPKHTPSWTVKGVTLFSHCSRWQWPLEKNLIEAQTLKWPSGFVCLATCIKKNNNNPHRSDIHSSRRPVGYSCWNQLCLDSGKFLWEGVYCDSQNPPLRDWQIW